MEVKVLWRQAVRKFHGEAGKGRQLTCGGVVVGGSRGVSPENRPVVTEIFLSAWA